MTTYFLTSIRLAGGEETPRFEAEVGVKLDTGATITGIATVSNGGTGGCCDWHWRERASEDKFKAFIKAKYPDEDIEPEDGWAYEQLDLFELNKKLMRWSLKKTVFTIEGDPAGEYRTLGAIDSPKVRGFIKTKYPGKKAMVFDRATKQFVEIT